MDTCYNRPETHTHTLNANSIVYTVLAALLAIGAAGFVSHQPAAAATTHHTVLLAPAQFPSNA
jgi:hypothetical protein